MRCYSCNQEDATVFDPATNRDYCVSCAVEISSISSFKVFENTLEVVEEEEGETE